MGDERGNGDRPARGRAGAVNPRLPDPRKPFLEASLGSEPREIAYFVLADRAVPYLLARVRWPDVAQAISAANPDWLDDTGLFDLPYDSNSVRLSFEQASSVAAAWGSHLQTQPTRDAPSYIRRMPANWSHLSPSELRAWGLEFVGRRSSPVRRRRRPDVATTEPAGVETERRQDVRIRLGGRAHIRYEDMTFSAGLVDLSERGAGCVLPEAPDYLSSGTSLIGPILLEAGSSTSRICLDVPSRINWRRSTPDGAHFGVVFSELATDETEGMQLFLGAANAV
jgi:hypothetical protein